MLGALGAASVLITLSPVTGAFGNSFATYDAGGVRFQAAFSSKVTTTALTKSEIKKSFTGVPGLGAATMFSAGIPASVLLSFAHQVPKPNAFEVTVITFASSSAATSFWQFYGSAPGAKKETIDGKRAYGVVGNVATLNPGSPVPDKNATQGDLAVLDGKSVFIATVETKAAKAAIAFLKSVKILS